MGNEFIKFKKLKAEYLCLLKISLQGEGGVKLFESKSIPLEKLEEYNIFLEGEIAKLKEELVSDGVDVNSYLENNNSLD